MGALSSSTLSVVIFSVSIPSLTFAVLLVYNLAQYKKEGRNVKEALTRTIIPTLVTALITIAFWMGLFCWSVAATIYREHNALVAAVPTAKQQQKDVDDRALQDLQTKVDELEKHLPQEHPQCWVRNYAVPAVSSPSPWGLATILCNTTIKPPYSVELHYDQSVTVGPFTFPVGSEFAKSEEYNEGTKIVALFDLHTIIPNEPFSIMATGSKDKFPLVQAGVIRAKGIALEFHP